ncbi:MAG: OmpA family protein [Rickettsiales bacterium]|jgi:outer membrane protein OmpA-like peptidoglycan-associated protein|nr:OmpA family protein [Rickettsiales bacterium]
MSPDNFQNKQDLTTSRVAPLFGRVLVVVFMPLVLGQCCGNFGNGGIEEKSEAKDNNSLESITDSNDYTGEASAEQVMNNILGNKYQNYSDVLDRNKDYDSSRYFGGLSKNARDGDPGKKFRFHDSIKGTPRQMADLYFLFNCWYYFETRGKNLGEATICKNSFIELSHSLRIGTGEKIVSNRKSLGTGLTEEEETIFAEFVKNKTINILFDYDAYKLNPSGIAKIGLLLRYLNHLGSDYQVTIIGHADRIGKPIYNNTLARRRANSVFNILLKNGVPRNLITVQNLGSKSPRVITRRGIKNQFNRRVEIIIDTDYRDQDLQPEPQIVQRNSTS